MSEYAIALAPIVEPSRVRQKSDEHLLEAIASGDDEALGAHYDR